MKVCTRCCKRQPLLRFYSESRGGYRAECKACQKRRSQYDRKIRPDYYRQKSRRRRIMLRAFLQSLKHGKRCTDCRRKFPYWVLQFDHLRDKKHQLSDLERFSSTDHILREAAKCELVCANCHACRTHERRKALKK